MKIPRVEVKKISEAVTPDKLNINKHTQKGGGLLENELRRRGAFRSIASAGKDTEVPVVYAGNFTLEKAVDAGYTEVINVYTDGTQLVNVVRTDIAPESAEAIALGISDNEIGKQSYNPDIDLLAAMSAGDNGVLSALKKDDKIFAGMLEGMGGYIPDLDELAERYGETGERDFYPVIRVQVSPETFTKYNALMAEMQGADDAEKFDALISRGN